MVIIGDLIRHKNFEQYGIVIDVITPAQGRGKYFVILWAGRLTTDWVWDDMIVKA